MEDVSVIKKAAEMNAEHLLTHFDRIADAPDAIPRLRRFILDLAVRGKLVPQDPNDEPASALLEKLSVCRAKESRKKNELAPLSEEEKGYRTPPGWEWVRFGEVFSIRTGFAFKSSTYSDSGILVLRVVNFDRLGAFDLSDAKFFPPEKIDKKISQFALNEGEILMVMVGGTIGKTTIVTSEVLPALLNQNMWRIRSFGEILNNEFEYLLIRSINQQIENLTNSTHGHFAMGDYEQKPICLPPLAEQHRIVAKVDELMALCDRLEAARVEREATRDRMATASLARLNAPDPDPATFQNHAAFALNNLTPLTTRPDQIKALRQTILDLAVRGKLVPQDPNDEPASEMLRKIAETRKFLIVERKMKRPKDLLPVENREIHFSIPAGWAITRMGVAYDVRDGTHDSPKYVDKGYPLITSKNLSSGYLSFDDTKLISKEDYIKISQRSAVVKGDILLAMIGSIGNPVIVDTDQPFAIKNVALLKYFDPDYSNPKFLRFFLLNAANEMKALAVGGLQPFVSLNFLRNYPLAIPPLAEQHRIVTKVDKLMAFCDQLEVSLTTSDETRGLLVEALLHETLVQGTPGQARRQVGRPAIYTTQDA